MPKADSQTHYDLVIVGASFSGLVCARAAALRGLRVLVLEAKKDPGARIHTTGILVKEAAEELDVPAHLTRTIHGVRLYTPALRSTDLFSPGSYFLTTRTADIVRWLGREAERAGAEIRCGTAFRQAERQGDRIILSSPKITCRYLVGADGARSRVARQFALGRNSRFLVGMEAEYSRIGGLDERFLHCFLDSRIAPGYISWLAPAPDVIQVGTAVSGRHRPMLGQFREHTSSLFDYRDENIVERRAGRIPCGGIVRPFAAPGVLLIGDAAGLVSPLTGGGIQLALRLGRRAGQLIADHLLRFGPAPEAVLAEMMPDFGRKMLLRHLLDLRPANFIYDLLLATGPMREFARRTYFHRRAAGGDTLEAFEERLSREAPRRLDGQSAWTNSPTG